jgi:hypothetical protein
MARFRLMLSLILALGVVFILTAHASRPFAVAGLAPPSAEELLFRPLRAYRENCPS